MWRLAKINSSFECRFSDVNSVPVGAVRGGSNVSCRLVVDGQGFLDLTELDLPGIACLNVNGSWLWRHEGPESPRLPLELCLDIPGDGRFTARLTPAPTSQSPTLDAPMTVSGKLKPLPDVSADDASFIDRMIAQNYVPYRNNPDGPGKTMEEIQALGQALFPFSQYHFQLAMCVYDWTTASFTRMVLLKIFEYTGVQETPFPIDQPSIAKQIWGSNWGPYVPSNADYMNSFMMTPAFSFGDVKRQLDLVASDLHALSNVQNRLLTAAMQALPRTSIFERPHLFSGQVDMSQLGLDHFGIEFFECPLNDGPVDKSLTIEFATAMKSYVAKGKIITTKMVWSFTDNIREAMHYSNGILLVTNIPDNSCVWETASYVSALSYDPDKIEYTFMPGSRFEVISAADDMVEEKRVCVIVLQPKPVEGALQPKPDEGAVKRLGLPAEAGKILHGPLEVQNLITTRIAALEGAPVELHCTSNHTSLTHFKPRHKTGGRRCACQYR
ncbi:hypothetical protein MVEN_01457600 [Mycena venus]|uniref:Uncharacterized protein n=1 Tax=Mycena venus TaxID=2733690 RepID=A0A8H6XUM6_9AGAR|nr:hypothetical protein MVEN_01457600 [Mycena venus]